ncbi:MAG TPA: hypothetical protein VFC33_06795 [Acidimicrobiia bacterium]|nr:hypothetical protein [Acidimicrobiia bacterium]
MSIPSLRVREFPERGVLVWYALTAPIGAWTVHLVGLTALTKYSDNVPGAIWWLHIITIVTGLVTLSAMYLSFLMMRWGGRGEDRPDLAGRVRFLGELGMIIGIANLALIVLEEVYVNVLHGVRY